MFLITEEMHVIIILLIKPFGGLVEVTFRQVHASYSGKLKTNFLYTLLYRGV